MTSTKRTIVLVGLMGTGKSTIARMLSTRLGYDCLDTDRLVESRVGMTVRQIFEESGEGHFRDLESDVLTECLRQPGGLVVAAAGGVVVRAENREILDEARKRGTATVVWLHARPDVLAKRTVKGVHRPLLDEDREGTLSRLGDERAPMYGAVADVVIDVSDRSAEAVVDLLMDAIDDDSFDEGGSANV